MKRKKNKSPRSIKWMGSKEDESLIEEDKKGGSMDLQLTKRDGEGKKRRAWDFEQHVPRPCKLKMLMQNNLPNQAKRKERRRV